MGKSQNVSKLNKKKNNIKEVPSIVATIAISHTGLLPAPTASGYQQQPVQSQIKPQSIFKPQGKRYDRYNFNRC